MEYVGEVISNETCFKKLEEQKEEINFYFLTLNSQEIIDARQKGNVARYINHSCKPNCMTQKWYEISPDKPFISSRSVEGEIRIGIFAKEDIKGGEELTFDYQFERFGPKKQPC